MPPAPALSVLLSQALIAFAIEYDNEFELRLWKTWARPFRVSMVMWSNFMRFVRSEGITIGELVDVSCIPKEDVGSVIGGMERWGYITVHEAAGGGAPRSKGFGSARGLKSETVIRPSMTGKLAQEIWDPLAGEIEARWSKRLGDAHVEKLRGALRDVQTEIVLVMPHFLPVVGRDGLFANSGLVTGKSDADDELAALLSRVLLAFTLDCESGSEVSLPLSANVLRVLTERGVPVKDLPLATGVSKEAVSSSMKWLEKMGHISVQPDPNARGKIVALTSKGSEAQAAYGVRLSEVEANCEKQFGPDRIGALRESLQVVLDQPGGQDGPLSAGLVTPPGGWRASGRYKPLTAAFVASPSNALPHYPMVLHRGGWPDGS